MIPLTLLDGSRILVNPDYVVSFEARGRAPIEPEETTTPTTPAAPPDPDACTECGAALAHSKCPTTGEPSRLCVASGCSLQGVDLVDADTDDEREEIDQILDEIDDERKEEAREEARRLEGSNTAIFLVDESPGPFGRRRPAHYVREAVAEIASMLSGVARAKATEEEHQR